MASDEYAIDYLLVGPRESFEDVDQFADGAAAAPALAHDLCVDFARRQPHYKLLEEYYVGNPPMPCEPARLTDEYRSLLDICRSNWAGLVVDVVDERLRVGTTVSTAEPTKDEQLWGWWQRNNMDGTSAQVHQATLKFGVCYVSCWPTFGGPNDGVPRIMGESPLCCYVRLDNETQEPIAAIRLWQGCCDGTLYCDLTTAEAQYKLIARQQPSATVIQSRAHTNRYALQVDPSTVEWMLRDPFDDVVPVRVNPYGVVPYVPLYNMPDLMGGFRSEIEAIIPIQDRIHKTTFDRLVSQEFAAFPQRYVTGVESWKDPETGEVKLPFDAAADRVWTATQPDTSFGQFEATTNQAYLEANVADINTLATVSRTPPHFLTGGMGQFPSGESVRATEFGLTRKVEARQQSYGDGWANALRMAALVAGDADLANDPGVGVVWVDMEARSEGEVVDALLKMGTLGVPWEVLWRRWGAQPEEIKDWSAQLEETVKRAQAFALATATPTANQTKQQAANSIINQQKITQPGDVDANPATPV